MRALSFVAVTSVFVAACTTTGPANGAEPTTPSDRGAETAPNPDRSFDPAAVEIAVREIVGGFDSPLGVMNAGDGSGRLFVLEQGGTIQIVEDGEVTGEFIDISDRLVSGGEQGLLGLAFHPNYEDNGLFYVNYTDTNGDTVVAEYEVTGDPDIGDPDSERVLLQVDQPFANHNGGNIIFGPDGFLHIGMGDGGSGGDPFGNGQSLNTLLGKMLRIDVDTSGGGKAYGIPEDNPFADGGGLPEIWAYGLRNPWRYSIDRKNGDLWIADVGQNEFEEVNHVRGSVAGVNYGWNVMEGRSCFLIPTCNRSGKQLPVTEYDHDQGCSVTGGFVYRGRAFRTMRGGYFFGDYCSGFIWTISARTRRFVEPTLLLDSQRSISSFGEDEAGELYFTDIASGDLLQVVVP